MRRAFTGYYTTHLAQKLSFAEVFSELRKLGLNPELAWSLTIRRKRGLTDSSKKGGCTKDLIYFEGAVKVWQWLQDKNNDPKDLYLARLNLKLINEKRNQANRKSLIYPTFFNNISDYLKTVNEIGKINKFAKI